MTAVTAVREGAGIAVATGAAIASEDLFELVTFSRSFGSLTLSVRRYPCATASSPSVPSTTSPTSFIRRSLPRPCPVWRRWTASRLPLRSRKAPTLRRSTRHTLPGSLSFCSKFSGKSKTDKPAIRLVGFGTPGETRTHYLALRRPDLSP